MKIDLSLATALETVRTLPTTNLRLAVTIFGWFSIIVAEVTWFVFNGDFVDIPLNFAGLLAIMAGLDGLQFLGKRHTNFSPEEVARARRIENGGYDAPELDAEAPAVVVTRRGGVHVVPDGDSESAPRGPR